MIAPRHRVAMSGGLDVRVPNDGSARPDRTALERQPTSNVKVLEDVLISDA